MSKTEAMAELKSSGTERHRQTFERHGVTGAYFGVPYAELYKLQKKIGTDQRLAEQLWATGNHDARILAAFVADPAAIKAATLDAWVKTVGNQLTLDAIAGLAARAPKPVARMTKWIKSKQEWTAAAGWHLLAAMATQPDGGGLGEDDYLAYLDQIEARIHDSLNRVKHSMNQAVIAIAGRPGLHKQALAVARRIGVVDVDHGDTSCKTPDAAAYIEKVRKHRAAKKKAKAAAR